MLILTYLIIILCAQKCAIDSHIYIAVNIYAVSLCLIFPKTVVILHFLMYNVSRIVKIFFIGGHYAEKRRIGVIQT